MEIFYSKDIEGGLCRLDAEESSHCVRVLRHRTGDRICVIDGEGTFYDCTVTDDNPKGVQAHVDAVQPCWGAHSYNLAMGVCPTKNIDRFEWFAEKATEMGVDEIVPLIGDRSERKVVKTERIRKILLSATKQSLKGAIPQVREAVGVSDFIRECASSPALKLIAYCFDDESVPRRSVKEVLAASDKKDVVILIGPEGDFSREEAALALECGFIPVHFGESRLRTETAALFAVSAVYSRFM